MKTDNSYLADKIELRLKFLKDRRNVLACFGGNNVIWKNIKQQISDINVTCLELDRYKKEKSAFYIYGNNLKIIPKLDLSIYEVIDLDAYGSPIPQFEKIINNKTLKPKTLFFLTNITTFGGKPYKELSFSGITPEMYKVSPLFIATCEEFHNSFYTYLHNKNILKCYNCRNKRGNKNYISFVYPQ